jgi:NAD(P)-dependent dehydrogenase (short-subunit alcohol dehydrogenase family)
LSRYPHFRQNPSDISHPARSHGGINFAELALRDDTPMTRYGQSKLANVLHAKTLHRRYGPGSPSTRAGDGEIWTAAVHPGAVESQLGGDVDVPAALVRTDGHSGAWSSVFSARVCR